LSSRKQPPDEKLLIQPRRSIRAGARFHPYSNSISAWPLLTASPGVAMMALTVPAVWAVMLVSIFIASSTTSRSCGCNFWPTCTLTRFTIQAIGLRHTFSSGRLSACGFAGCGRAPGTYNGDSSRVQPTRIIVFCSSKICLLF